jgi:integrase
MVKRRAAKAGISKTIVAHSLRHTCGTIAAMNDAPLLPLQKHMRQRDPRTTERYIHAAALRKQKMSQFIQWNTDGKNSGMNG